jgi:hypothetical protein
MALPPASTPTPCCGRGQARYWKREIGRGNAEMRKARKRGCVTCVPHGSTPLDRLCRGRAVAGGKVTEPYAYLGKPVHEGELSATIELMLCSR